MITAPDITIRTGDTLPYVQQYLRSRDGSIFPVPAGTLVEFAFRTYAIPQPLEEVTGQIVDGPAGLVRAQLGPPLPSGRYQAFWRLTLATSDVVSFPDGTYLWLQVTPE